jgi:hypothetical protein
MRNGDVLNVRDIEAETQELRRLVFIVLANVLKHQLRVNLYVGLDRQHNSSTVVFN